MKKERTEKKDKNGKKERQMSRYTYTCTYTYTYTYVYILYTHNTYIYIYMCIYGYYRFIHIFMGLHIHQWKYLQFRFLRWPVNTQLSGWWFQTFIFFKMDETTNQLYMYIYGYALYYCHILMSRGYYHICILHAMV